MEAALIACLYAATPTGVAYGFSLYSESLRARFHWSEGELLNLATVAALLGPLSPLIGWLVHRFGPRRSILCGGAVATAAEVLQYHIARGNVSLGDPRVSLAVCSCVTGLAMGAFCAVAFTTPVKCYPRLRGQAVSIVKSFVGLSGAAVTQLYWLLIGRRPGLEKRSPESLKDLLIWACTTAACTAIVCLLIPGEVTADPRHESERRLALLWWLCMLWCFGVAVVSVVASNVIHTVLAVALLSALSCPILLLAVWMRAGPQEGGAAAACGGPTLFETPRPVNLKGMLSTAEAWCLFVVGFVLIGSSYFLSTSMSQILSSAGFPSDDINVLTQTLFSAGNMLGRLTCMIPSDGLVRRGIARPYSCVAILATMMASQALFLLLPHSAGSGSLIAGGGAVLGGYSFGAVWPHLVVICSEVFGSLHLSTNYMFFDGGCAVVGTCLFARIIAADVYQAHVGDRSCTGSSCFFATHMACIGAGLFASVCAVALGLQSAPLYRSIRTSPRASTAGIESPGPHTALVVGQPPMQDALDVGSKTSLAG